MRRVLFLLLILFLSCDAAPACELCDGPGSSFVAIQDHVERWPMVAIGEPLGRSRQGRVEFRVEQVLKGDKNLVRGAKVAPRGGFAVLPGHVWLLLGRQADFSSGVVLMLKPGTLKFLLDAPRLPPEDKPAERLLALVPWLTHADPMVSASARKAFAKAPYAALKKAAAEVEPDRLAEVLADPKRSPGSRGALFLLFGQSGSKAQRKLLATWMDDPAAQSAPGFDALIAAWLMLTGIDGVAKVRRLLSSENAEVEKIGGAYLRALGFHARNEEILAREDVLDEVSTFLETAVLAAAAVDELARSKDRQHLDAVLAAHRQLRERDPEIASATVRYLEAHPDERAKKALAEINAAALAGPAK